MGGREKDCHCSQVTCVAESKFFACFESRASTHARNLMRDLTLLCFALMISAGQLLTMWQRAIRLAARALLVSAGCLLAGFSIGTVAHFLGGGFGLNWAALQFAAGEGGIPGGAIGLLVGLLIFYAIFHGQASWRDWAILASVSLVTATVALMVVFVLTVVITPMVTITVAVAMRSK